MAKDPWEVASRLQRKHAAVAQHLADVIAAHARTRYELKKTTQLLYWTWKKLKYEQEMDELADEIVRTIEAAIPNYIKAKQEERHKNS